MNWLSEVMESIYIQSEEDNGTLLLLILWMEGKTP